MLNTRRKRMSDADPSRPVRRPDPVVGEVIDPGPASPGPGATAAAPRGAEPALRSLHGLLLGITTIVLAVPAVIAVIAVTVLPIVAWLLIAAALRIVFRILALLTGSRPEAVMPGAFLRAQAMRGFSTHWSGVRR